MSDTPVNVIRTSTGKLRPVCEFCGRIGRAAAPALPGGQLSVWDVARGWAVAPYPADFTHPDGSTGDLWRCRTCADRLDRGEALHPRRTPTTRVLAERAEVGRENLLRCAVDYSCEAGTTGQERRP